MKALEVSRHDFLVFQGILVCILQALAASTLPALEYLWVFNGKDFRWSVEQYVHWGVATIPAILAWLALHIAVGAMFGAALAADNVSAFNTLDTRCSLAQAAYDSCAACPCAASNSCTQGCAAPSVDLCSAFTSNRIVVAVAGAVTVATMAVPVAVSLVLFARLAAQHAMRWAQLAAAGLRAQERLELLGLGLAPSLPQACVRGDIQALERSRVAELQALASQLQAALAKAGYIEAAEAEAGARDDSSIEAPLLISPVPRLEQPSGLPEQSQTAAPGDEKKKKKKKKHAEVAGEEALALSEPESPDARF
ncbi:hypothetical protein WJX81_007850 [Elliptochloris bilobata]|uniref:Uncharacterized protein n=1 Tax=Elliptochloris bilobata TaxID=381761 RepID=A0AAW1R2G9_9CHLO